VRLASYSLDLLKNLYSQPTNSILLLPTGMFGLAGKGIGKAKQKQQQNTAVFYNTNYQPELVLLRS